jgi:hypothetical protein
MHKGMTLNPSTIKKKTLIAAGDVNQVVEHLPSKLKALNFIPSATEKALKIVNFRLCTFYHQQNKTKTLGQSEICWARF